MKKTDEEEEEEEDDEIKQIEKEMSEKLDAIIGAEHSKGNTSSHEQQNN